MNLTTWDTSAPVAVTVVVDPFHSVAEANEENNSMTVQLTPAVLLPDLIVAGINSGPGNHLGVIVRNNRKANLPLGSRGIADVLVNGQKAGFFDLGTPTESFFGGIGAVGGFSSYLLSLVVVVPHALFSAIAGSHTSG